jgi:hypothetical protein
MSEALREQRLRTALRVFAILIVVGFLGFYVLALLGSPLTSEGGFLAAIIRWRPYNLAYEGMLVAVYTVWGLFLWRASHNPRQHRLLIDFTIAANFVHAGVMLVAAFVLPGETVHAVGDVALLVLIAGVLLWLRPRSETAPAL